GEKLRVGETDPENPDDRPDLVAGEEENGRQKEQPLAGTLPEQPHHAARPAPVEVDLARCDRLCHVLSQLTSTQRRKARDGFDSAIRLRDTARLMICRTDIVTIAPTGSSRMPWILRSERSGRQTRR